MLFCQNHDCEHRNDCLKKLPCATCDLSHKCIVDYINIGTEVISVPYIIVGPKTFVLKTNNNDNIFDNGMILDSVESVIINIDLLNLEFKDLTIVNVSQPNWLLKVNYQEFCNEQVRNNLLKEILTWNN